MYKLLLRDFAYLLLTVAVGASSSPNNEPGSAEAIETPIEYKGTSMRGSVEFYNSRIILRNTESFGAKGKAISLEDTTVNVVTEGNHKGHLVLVSQKQGEVVYLMPSSQALHKRLRDKLSASNAHADSRALEDQYNAVNYPISSKIRGMFQFFTKSNSAVREPEENKAARPSDNMDEHQPAVNDIEIVVPAANDDQSVGGAHTDSSSDECVPSISVASETISSDSVTPEDAPDVDEDVPIPPKDYKDISVLSKAECATELKARMAEYVEIKKNYDAIISGFNSFQGGSLSRITRDMNKLKKKINRLERTIAQNDKNTGASSSKSDENVQSSAENVARPPTLSETIRTTGNDITQKAKETVTPKSVLRKTARPVDDTARPKGQVQFSPEIRILTFKADLKKEWQVPKKTVFFSDESSEEDSTSDTEDFSDPTTVSSAGNFDETYKVTPVDLEKLSQLESTLETFPPHRFVDFKRTLSDDQATKLFRNNPHKTLKGNSICRARTISLNRVLNDLAPYTNGADLQILSNVLPLDVLRNDVQSREKVMVQTFVSDLVHVIEAGEFPTGQTIAAPIAATYFDYLFPVKSHLSELKQYVNSDGTGFLARELVKDEKLIVGWEKDHELNIWEAAAIFGPAVRDSVYELPSGTIRTADFSVIQKIDLDGLLETDWVEHKELLGRYIALMYESTYLSAIEVKAKHLILSPVLVNATVPQLSYMINVLARVHHRLSRYLEDCSFVLVMPEFAKDLFESRHDFNEAISLVTLGGGVFTHSIAGTDQAVVLTSTVVLNVLGSVARKANQTLEIDIRIVGSGVDVDLRRDSFYHLSLNRYFDSEEEKILRSSSIIEHPNGCEVLSDKVVVNSITFESSHQKK